MPQVLPMTRVEAYLAYKAGVISEADLKPSLKTNFYSGLEHWLAYWCGLCDDYPTEDGQPKWYTEEEYYVAYLCGIAPDYPINCYRRVGAYLRYIISARWDKPEKPLTREEYYLSLMSTTYLPPNDPASIISIDDTAEAPFGDLKIYGDSFQQTYTGKSILGNTVDAIKALAANSGTWSGNAYTKNGVTYTLNVNNGMIESISLSGTASANSNFFLADDTPADFLTKVQEGQDYTLSGCPSGGSPTTYYLRIQERPYKQLFTDTGDSLSKSMPTLSSGATAVQFLIGVDSGTDTTGLVYKPMFESGSSPTAFEPYVGGIPAPNPDYPQDVNVVTGNQTVKVTGKNLFELGDSVSSYFATNQNGLRIRAVSPATRITATFTEDTMTVTSYNYTGYYWLSKQLSLRKNTNYTLSAESHGRTRIVGFDSLAVDTDGTLIAEVLATDTLPVTFNSGNYKYIVISIYPGAQNNLAVVSKQQVEIGSTATDYQPYQSQSYPLSLGSLELAKIGDYQDYLWTDGEKWYKHKVVESYNFANFVYTGSTTKQAHGYVVGATVNPLVGAVNPLVGLCSHFGVESTNTTWTGLNKTGTNAIGALWFETTTVANSDTRTASDFIDWANSNNVAIHYALATPTDEEITDATLISQLNALLEGGSYDYQTNIVVSATEPNLPGLLQVTAAKWQ